ncbi:unnamed protein product [Adineta steineri]|uniref:Uncharacterized protein n=1 Tax=Adineta steineri TaxID=433720 RepID=A0A819C6X9_9BILA|nr:unnamed protein product [Adineta steineri]
MLPFGKDNLNMTAGASSLLTLFLASMVFMGFLIKQDIHIRSYLHLKNVICFHIAICISTGILNYLTLWLKIEEEEQAPVELKNLQLLEHQIEDKIELLHFNQLNINGNKCIMVFINTIATIVQYQFIFCDIAEASAVEEEAREIEMQEFNKQ